MYLNRNLNNNHIISLRNTLSELLLHDLVPDLYPTDIYHVW